VPRRFVYVYYRQVMYADSSSQQNISVKKGGLLCRMVQV